MERTKTRAERRKKQHLFYGDAERQKKLVGRSRHLNNIKESKCPTK